MVLGKGSFGKVSGKSSAKWRAFAQHAGVVFSRRFPERSFRFLSVHISQMYHFIENNYIQKPTVGPLCVTISVFRRYPKQEPPSLGGAPYLETWH